MTYEKIPARTNLYLWFLTGRSDDFANATLNTGVLYSVNSTPPEVEKARALLGLGVTNSDFNVLGVLASAKISVSLLRDLPPELDAVFSRGMLQIPNVSSTATLLPLTDTAWPNFDGRRAGKDGYTQVVFTAVDATTSTINTNAGGSEKTAHATVAEDGGTFKVQFDKAAEYGISAAFRVSSWSPGDQIYVDVAQTKYPYVDIAAKINRDGDSVRLMNAEGTLATFSETSNPAVKVGMLGVAIIRRMLKVINETQAGFEITVTTDDDAAEPLREIYSIDQASVWSLDTPDVDDQSPLGFDA